MISESGLIESFEIIAGPGLNYWIILIELSWKLLSHWIVVLHILLLEIFLPEMEEFRCSELLARWLWLSSTNEPVIFFEEYSWSEV